MNFKKGFILFLKASQNAGDRTFTLFEILWHSTNTTMTTITNSNSQILNAYYMPRNI